MPPDQSAAVEELLVALERLSDQAKQRAREARAGVEKHTFAPYHAYRAAIAEYEALVSVIEGRLEGQPAPLVARTKERLVASRRKALTLSIKAAFNIFFPLSAFSSLPIGVREVFTQELVQEQALETAEMILNEVIGKAPSLVDFGLGR